MRASPGSVSVNRVTAADNDNEMLAPNSLSNIAVRFLLIVHLAMPLVAVAQ